MIKPDFDLNWSKDNYPELAVNCRKDLKRRDWNDIYKAQCYIANTKPIRTGWTKYKGNIVVADPSKPGKFEYV